MPFYPGDKVVFKHKDNFARPNDESSTWAKSFPMDHVFVITRVRTGELQQLAELQGCPESNTWWRTHRFEHADEEE